MSLVFISLGLHAYIAWRLLPSMAAGSLPAAILMAMWLVFSAGLIPLGLWARRLHGRPRVAVWAVIGLGGLGLFSYLFVFTVLRDVGLLAVTVVDGLGGLWGRHFPETLRTDIQSITAWGVPALTLAAGALGFAAARRLARVVTVEVPIAHLPAALQGFTLAQISDLHVGPTIKGDTVAAVVAAVNRLEADVVAITGDLVDGSVAELAPHVAPLAQLRSRHGSFFVTGNHEYYSGAAAWIAELRRLGIAVLLNEHVVLTHDGATLVLAGVTDYSAPPNAQGQRSDPHAALRGAPTNAAVRVLLAHQPRSAEAAAAAGFDLQLSGHTHGGQFWPWNFLVPLQQPFTAGLHRWQQLWVYTSRGTGYWGPPLRLGAPAEITRVRLVRAATPPP